MEISISGPKDFYLSIYHIAQEAREKGLVFYVVLLYIKRGDKPYCIM